MFLTFVVIYTEMIKLFSFFSCFHEIVIALHRLLYAFCVYVKFAGDFSHDVTTLLNSTLTIAFLVNKRLQENGVCTMRIF